VTLFAFAFKVYKKCQQDPQILDHSKIWGSKDAEKCADFKNVDWGLRECFWKGYQPINDQNFYFSSFRLFLAYFVYNIFINDLSCLLVGFLIPSKFCVF